MTRKDEKLAEFKKCGHCGANPGGNRKYCAKPECQRAAAAARKARQRAREAEPVSESALGEKEPEKGTGPVWSEAQRQAVRLVCRCADCASEIGEPDRALPGPCDWVTELGR